jgi:precorrin-4/cobalt-precorrin-4 C11-methyltransferase
VSDIAKKAEEAGIRRTALVIVGKVVEPRTSGFRRSFMPSDMIARSLRWS